MGCSQSAQAKATLTRENSQMHPSEPLARSETSESPLTTQDSEYLEDQMIDQFDDPMKFYTKSKTILNNVAPDRDDDQDNLLVKQNSGDSACLPDPSSYDAESEVCRQNTDTPYNDPMDYDCDSDSGDFASVKLEHMKTDFPDADFPEDGAPAADPAPEDDFPEATSPEEDVHEDEPSPEAPVLEAPETLPCVEPAAEEFEAEDPEPESDCESAKPSAKKLKTKRRKPKVGKQTSLKRQKTTLKRQKTTVKKPKNLKAPGPKRKGKGKPKVHRKKTQKRK